MGISGLGRADPQHAPSNQPWRQIATLPRALARTKTITAGFVIGAQPPAATVPLAAPDALSFKTRRNPALPDQHDRPWLSIDQPASRDRDPLAVTDLLPAGAPPPRVASADVDVWLPQGSPLDHHAARTAAAPTGVGYRCSWPR
jgi:hypothetical protein